MIDDEKYIRVSHCPLCERENSIGVGIRGRAGKAGPSRTLSTVMCWYCGLVYIKKRLSSTYLDQVYAQHYEEMREEDATKPQGIKGIAVGKLLADYIRAQGKVLEIGAGRGIMTNNLKTNFAFDITAIEQSAQSVAYAKATWNIDMVHGAFDEVYNTLPQGHFDAVILHHVFEHIAEPRQFLTKVRMLLNDSGVLYIEVPNIQKFNKPVWHFFDPLHLYNYSAVTLASMLEAGGFNVVHETKKAVHLQVLAQKREQTMSVSRQPGEVLRTACYLLAHYVKDSIRWVYYRCFNH